ncbi:MAG: hypothetical protein WA160_11580 [Pseudobdellovibrio sp.]
MKIIFFLVFSLMTSLSSARMNIDILPLQLQSRFEDTAAQSKEMVRYQSFGTAFQIDDFRFGYDYSSHANETGIPSLSIQTKTNESLFSSSYRIFNIEGAVSKLSLDLFVGIMLGLSNSEVQTRLLGASAVTSANSNMVLGLGTSAVGRWKFLILETEVKVLNSKDFNPSSVFATDIKLGLSFEI